jgi:predicted flap endonuclease-1-like 5' DNA nuclease
MNVQDVEGIGPSFAEQLAAAGITTTDELLERGARPKGRARLAEETGISPALVLEWVNHVDLMRLDGVGSQYADLLSLAGVDSPLELARRNPANLARTFSEIDAARSGDVRRVPSEATVTGWVEEAKTLPRAVFHDDEVSPRPEAEAVPVAEAVTEPAAPAAKTQPAAVPSTVRPLASTPAAAAERPGLWARIKRVLRLG